MKTVNQVLKRNENEIVSATNAVKNGKVFYLDPEIWYLSGGGLQSETQKLKMY